MRSVSQLSSYSSCGEAYRLERVAKAPVRPAAWFSHGKAAHMGVETWEESHRSLSPEEVRTVVEDYYVAEITKLREKYPDEAMWMTGGFKKGWADIEDRLSQALWQVNDYMRLAKEEETLWRVIASELEFTITLGGVEVKGFIDQVIQRADGTILPVDLKTGSKKPGNAPLQLGTYAVAIERLMECDRPTEGVILQLGRPATAKGKEKPSKAYSYNLEHWTPERLGALFAQMDQSERQGIYLPNPTADCHRTCGVAQYCPVVGHGPSAEQYERKIA
ncbi:RecB family exonuclease [Glutamicibacter creatinolyticus]|uniref:RecB family exonuclease n=1 Tax=Glutamicibacter creatinolyticus TaxID=162496 RepID=UPI003217C937